MQAILAKHQNSEVAKLENEDLGLDLNLDLGSLTSPADYYSA